jgi:hypothetical protein
MPLLGVEFRAPQERFAPHANNLPCKPSVGVTSCPRRKDPPRGPLAAEIFAPVARNRQAKPGRGERFEMLTAVVFVANGLVDRVAGALRDAVRE